MLVKNTAELTAAALTAIEGQFAASAKILEELCGWEEIRSPPKQLSRDAILWGAHSSNLGIRREVPNLFDPEEKTALYWLWKAADSLLGNFSDDDAVPDPWDVYEKALKRIHGTKFGGLIINAPANMHARAIWAAMLAMEAEHPNDYSRAVAGRCEKCNERRAPTVRIDEDDIREIHCGKD